MKFTIRSLLAISALICQTAAVANAQQIALPQANDDWYVQGQATLKQRMTIRPINHLAKNVILMIGDGNDPTTIIATRIFAGQLTGKPGEEHVLPYEKFPYVAYSKTYNTNAQTPDSAGTASAIMTGVKTLAGVLGVTENVRRGNCSDALANSATTIGELTEAAGMATGIVTTTRITHATPAAVFAHSADRGWEVDSRMPDELADGCKDIAAQLIDFPFGDGIDVAMGGGRRNFIGTGDADPEDEDRHGKRKDGRNLINEWQAKSNNHLVVYDTAGFDALDTKSKPKVLALFARSHMNFETDRENDVAGEPSLAHMTKKAIEILSQEEKGYFLMVEGGRIDHASHGSNAYRTLTDGKAFADAVQMARTMTNEQETLIIVTADHGHQMTMAGYAQRGNPILGLVMDINKDGSPSNKPVLGRDGKPYTVLSFSNGPGAIFNKKDKRVKRPDLSNIDTQSHNFRQPALVPTRSETHGGQDVGIYALGPMSHLFGGVVEQNYIFHVMQHALDLRRRANAN